MMTDEADDTTHDEILPAVLDSMNPGIARTLPGKGSAQLAAFGPVVAG
jgi:hypothetical protein